MTKITYDDKMNFLEELQKRQKFLNESCKSCLPDEELNKNIDIIECIMEDIRDFKEKMYKHWNLFYNGKTGQYIIYLEKNGKADMIEISKELYYIIHEKVGI